jgi:hypothetical protein
VTDLALSPGQRDEIVSKLAVELDEALGLLREFQLDVGIRNLGKSRTPPSTLLDQCLALCVEHSAAKPEPIRTIHHFACTGGTLISKCIASMPNTQLLSEVDPLSTPVSPSADLQFAPTDMITLMRHSTRGTSVELIVELFLSNLEIVYTESLNTGLRLVLRDHAHSHYCRGSKVPERLNLLRLVAARFPTLSVVTVRDPIDSYLSLKTNEWVHFTPSTFDEYCARYIAFIEAYRDVPVIRFEDFTHEPKTEMSKICDFLDLPFNPDFCDLFGVHQISGDSGRAGNKIEPRSRRFIDAVLINEIEASANYQLLRSKLGYLSINN